MIEDEMAETTEEDVEVGFWEAYKIEAAEALAEVLSKAQTIRLKNCGTYHGRIIDGETGRIHASLFRCGLWRHCPICCEGRAKHFVERMHHAVLQARRGEIGPIRMAILDQEDATELARYTGKAQYLRLPGGGGDGDVLFIAGPVVIDGAEVEIGTPVTYDQVSALDWRQLTNTPSGRGVSGNLGKAEPTEEDLADTFTVEVKQVILDGKVDDRVENAAVETAVLETADCDPHTPEEVQECTDRRMDAYIRAIEASGGSILHEATRIVKRECRISRIAWKGYTERILKYGSCVGKYESCVGDGATSRDRIPL